MKKLLVTLLVCIMTILTQTLTACGNDEKPNKDEEINQAVSNVIEFLNSVKDSGNYSSVSEFPDGSVYKYYTAYSKIKVEYNKVEYNEVFYGVKEGNILYKISQADDTTWHKITDTTDLSDPIARTNNLINGVNNTSNAFLWTDYNSKTKTLTATYSDGSGTYKLDAGEFIWTIITDKGITKHTINNVGKTVVSLPENIIDDTTK